MTEDRRDKLLGKDWSDLWDELPEAPPLVPGPKTAQITLRLSPGLVDRVRRVAELRSLPYHALARSWLIHAVQRDKLPPAEADAGPHTSQLNIKLDEQAVDALKARADQLRRPYHRLAREWIAAAVAREEERLGLGPLDGEQPGPGPPSPQAASPYSTGGGGVTFERRVAALYLAMLLTGETAAELGADREIRSVAFQQAPRVPVDDLVILAARPEEPEPSLELAVGVRRKPKLVTSDGDAQALIVEYLRALLTAPADGPERRLALAVAGTQPPAQQLAELAALAAKQMDAAQFFNLVKTPKKFGKQLRTRLTHVEALVRNGLPELGVADPDDRTVARHVWELLRRLVVVMHRVEEPDTRDWDNTRRQLRSIARGGGVVAAGHLLDRLESLAGQYGPSAATVDRAVLSRHVHSLLDATRSRTARAWELLDELQRQARAAVRDHVGTGGPENELHLDRSSEGDSVMAAAYAADAVIVTGDSGVGKSALVLEAVAAAEAASKGELQAVCLNLRQLPERFFDLVTQLGSPPQRVLSELSAPNRYLIIDAADAATEAHEQVFSALVQAANNSGVRVIAITGADTRQVIRDLITAQVREAQVAEHVVEGLSDAQLQELAQKFPKLQRLAVNPRSRGLLRRLVVVDLLVRSEVSGVPLTDADAMHQIWERLVRKHGRRDRGLPDAREQVMLRLALRELSRGSASEAARDLDPPAVNGLRQDGMLRTSSNPWQVIPEFAHDEIRRYAVARALLADGDPGAALLDGGAPRWALSAAVLACQAILGQPDTADAPVRGRLQGLQRGFDALVEAGHGARWADLPSEAVLTLGDPRPVLADAWPDLRADDGAGFQRLFRLVDHRHRDATGTVDPVVVEPIVALLLEDETPWWGSQEAATLLREWLLVLVIRDTPAGDSLRVRLRDRLVAAGAVAERELLAEQEAAAAARAARTPEQIEQERARAERDRLLFSQIGYGTRRRRERAAVPRALTDETMVELVALLGPDLGEGGEQLLRRVGRDAPWKLAPAVEEIGTGRALASYGNGLLPSLVEAYYIDEDEDGSGFHEDGVRDHRWRGPMAPLAAWYRGPFWELFQSDFRHGVSVLNRLLNHAAQARARTLAGLGDPWGRASDDAVAIYSVELGITGAPRTFVGDDHVWRWYRGTGVGPYPCMSALQALERYCDQLLAAEIPPDWLVPILLDGCENLAMPGLVVGLLVRHIERAGGMLDPFFAEPMVWHLEFVRVTSESAGLAASSEGVAHPDRRTWSLREAAMWLTIQADRERADELRAVGEQLVARAAELTQESAQHAEEGQSEALADDVTVVRGWASALDRNTYSAQAEEDRVVFQISPPEDVQAALEPDNEDLRRGQEVLRIQMRYFRAADPRRADAPPPSQAEVAKDLARAQELVADPPTRSAVGIPEAAAAIAAYALRALLAGEVELDEQARKFIVEVILEVAQGDASPDPFEFEGSLFEMGADRAAARSLPFLLLPAAVPLRALAARERDEPDERVLVAGRRLAQATPMETRLFLARGLDVVWSTPCHAEGECHHKRGFQLAVESMRDCVFGEWNESARQVMRLPDPVVEMLADVPDSDIFVTKLDAAIRALGVAAVSDVCVSTEARQLLTELLLAQRRGFLARKEDFDERGSHALVAARALLALASVEEEQPLREHIAAYADRGFYLSSLLRGFAAAAEETEQAARTARQLWPSIIEQVLELNSSGHQPFSDRYYGAWTLAALAPTPTADIEFLHWEVGKEPISWRDPLGWQDALDAWLPVAAGEPKCIDSFISLVRELPVEQQISFGLPRVATLVEGDVNAAATRSYLLAEWLKELRATTLESESQAAWQRLVDALVVAGNRTLAPYSQ